MACYRESNNTIVSVTSGTYTLCGAVSTDNPQQPCCPSQSGAVCLGSNTFLCWEQNPVAGGTGYLTAACTDETYQSSACARHCIDEAVPDVVYNPRTGLWACCGGTEGAPNCANPTNETWAGPADDALLNAAVAKTSLSTASLATLSATASSAATTSRASISSSSTSTDLTSAQVLSSTSTPSETLSTTFSSSQSVHSLQSSQTSSAATTAAVRTTASSVSSPSLSPYAAPTVLPHTSSSLSVGAKTGIGVGVTIVVLALICLITYGVLARRKHKRQRIRNRPEITHLIPEYEVYGPEGIRRPSASLSTTGSQNRVMYERPLRGDGSPMADMHGSTWI